MTSTFLPVVSFSNGGSKIIHFVKILKHKDNVS